MAGALIGVYHLLQAYLQLRRQLALQAVLVRSVDEMCDEPYNPRRREAVLEAARQIHFVGLWSEPDPILDTVRKLVSRIDFHIRANTRLHRRLQRVRGTNWKLLRKVHGRFEEYRHIPGHWRWVGVMPGPNEVFEVGGETKVRVKCKHQYVVSKMGEKELRIHWRQFAYLGVTTPGPEVGSVVLDLNKKAEGEKS